MSTKNPKSVIVNGVILSFDVFEKKEIERIREKIFAEFGVKSKVEKTVLMGGFESEIAQDIWNVELSPRTFEVVRSVCEKKGFEFNLGLVEKYLQNFQIRCYNSPNLPYSILSLKITLNEDALNASSDLRKDLWQVSLPIRLFVESLDGFTKEMGTFSPRSSVVTQLWIKIEKQHLVDVRKTETTLIEKDGETFGKFEEKKDLNRKLIELEPIYLSDPIGDIHSHILNGTNVSIVLGQISQPALGGLRTPYILYLSDDEDLLESKKVDPFPTPVEFFGSGIEGIVWQGYTFLVGLISTLIYLSHIYFERIKIDSQLTTLRDSLTTKNSKKQIDQLLFELNDFGTRISSILNALGTFSRRWESAINRISKGKDTFALEIPISNFNSFGFLVSDGNLKGYLGTLSDRILAILQDNKESFLAQKSEVESIRLHISDVVNLKISKSNENLQRSMKRLTIISVIIAIMALAISLFVGWYGIQIATSDYQRTHPEGEYFVNLYYLGYDVPTNRDSFRITINYQGRGESKFLRLDVGIVGANSVVTSKANVEVMEPNIILARDYVDGLTGWVDYTIQRFASLNRTRISILDFSSDVETSIIDQT